MRGWVKHGLFAVALLIGAAVVAESQQTRINGLLQTVNAQFVTATSWFRGPDGSTTTPGFSFTNDTNTGLRNPGNQLYVVVNGSDRALLDASGLDLATNPLVFGTGFGSADIRVRRTAAKTLTVDDGAGGALTEVRVIGALRASTGITDDRFNNQRIPVADSNGTFQQSASLTFTGTRLTYPVAQLTPQASAPSSPAAGDIYVDSTPAPDELCFYDGAAWQGISSGTDANCS